MRILYSLFVPIFALTLLSACTTNSISTAFDDSRNESLARKRIEASHPAFQDAHFDVTSFDGIVLITGQVSSADIIPIATSQVKPLRNVRKVHNELTVAGTTSVISRTNDSWLTTKTKSALSASDKADASRIKVVTENGVVYMMGLLTRAEADAAVEITRQIQGVQKIVKVFEYIN
ncbi:MAG: BON domain-containing protein [Gammaproteobacteria bacterium]|jgi:osmotically-inducible protein OsmY|nr:BON domain-containing protein [Gammaproteobacteria bacterium]MBT4494259.1 BON domain-containing protein [Gammaproteobacteria bacterium]MBT7369290.1 BON domain-containing protein [Gammaproteobacteria bacterium]